MIPGAGDPLDALASPLAGRPADGALGQGLVAVGPTRRNWRQSLGWSSTSAPVALLLILGAVLGPRGINLLAPAVLSFLDPVVPVALAALGALVGLGVHNRRADDRPLLAAACVGAGLTTIVVMGGMAAVLALPWSATAGSWTLAWIAGLCAATSLTLPTGHALAPRTAATRITEFGVLPPIVAGGLAVALLREASPAAALLLLVEASAVTTALAAAGWLLLTQASSETEERVCAIAALLLVGGVADALSLSALFGGLAAGIFWHYAGRAPRERLSRDILSVQHPLVLLVLLVAGARTDISAASLGLAAIYVLLRAGGMLSAALVARHAVKSAVPRDLARHLLLPGVFGVGLALNAGRGLGADASVVLATVVVGTIGSELVALLLWPREVEA